MNVEQLRDAREANPFRPFTIHLADGRSLEVPHRDYLSMAPGGRTVIVYKSDGGHSIVEMLLVTELAFASVPANPGNGST
jgi:hypothetical protein